MNSDELRIKLSYPFDLVTGAEVYEENGLDIPKIKRFFHCSITDILGPKHN